MDPLLADLVSLLDLETVELNIFRGQSRDIGNPQVFGGQVLGQALVAASRTVEDRAVHSLHAYFLRAGDPNAPIVYEVDRSRDGRSFTNRRVIAIQHGRQIFNMTASFQIHEEGLDHRVQAPQVEPPDDLKDISEIHAAELDSLPEKVREFLSHKRPFHVRPVGRDEPYRGGMEPLRSVWMRAVDRLPDDPVLHAALLAYVSDYELLATATLPHGDERLLRARLQMASLDHAMWFHRDCRVDDWLLFSFDSPSASGARGLARGQVFTNDGVLTLSTAQEGLIRLR
ncbi:MAG: acyl-CoA thioesterase II [Gammaproteobacteria bacterium]|nr:acyl-CoA thioesterase II [Gammaproteobacteria bacterium]